QRLEAPGHEAVDPGGYLRPAGAAQDCPQGRALHVGIVDDAGDKAGGAEREGGAVGEAPWVLAQISEQEGRGGVAGGDGAVEIEDRNGLVRSREPGVSGR